MHKNNNNSKHSLQKGVQVQDDVQPSEGVVKLIYEPVR